jgi:cytochrome c-type biogenesis protein CcmH/NrfG
LTEILLGALLFVLVAAFVLVPLRRERSQGGEDSRIAELESRKEAKYREIRDTELDHAAGKLDDEDFRRQDAELRRDAVAILNQLDEAKGQDAG